MNTLQLKHVLSNDPFIKNSFGGVYACDQLEEVTVEKYPQSFVVNTDPKHLPGTHWIAIYFTEDLKAEFFDSYGLHPTKYNEQFLTFIERNSVDWLHNEKHLQSPFSSVCGQYCIYFLHNRCRNITMTSIVN